jgi:hypothetical protein
MGLTIDHITNVVNAMDLSIVVNSVDSLGSGKYKLFTTNTKWAMVKEKLDTCTIEEVSENSYIIVKSSIALSKGIYYLKAPYLIYGTLVDTNKEQNKKAQKNIDRTPFIYLHLNASEDYKDEESTIDFESDCAFYFMATSKADWLTEDHVTNTFKPMTAMAKEFIKALRNYSYLNASNKLTYTLDNDIAFGQLTNNKGEVMAKFFTDNLSGRQLLSRISFNKCFSCCN